MGPAFKWRALNSLDSIADGHHGVVGYSVIDLENGAAISRRGDETFPTASLIKDGETDQVRTECSLWYLRNHVIACVLTKENKDTRWIADNEAQLTLARMGEAIVNAWGGVPPASPPP